MQHLRALILSLGVLSLLAGCQMQSSPGTGAADGVTPDAVAGGAIEVTALDGTDLAEGAETTPPPAADPGEKQQSAAPAAEEDPAPAKAEPAPQPDLQPDLAEPVPVKDKSDQQKACEKKKGRWVKAGPSSHTCIFETRDSGKHCTRESQCEGVCLARSGTCAPVKPLLGCNEILQDNGARVTLCIE